MGRQRLYRGLPRVVIVGSGFGGMQAAQSLAGAEAEVLLIDRHNYHTFVPLLYQVVGAQLDPGQIAYPIRTLLRGSPNLHFRMAEVKRLDFTAQVVETEEAMIPYDYLVLATGSQTQFLGVPGAAEYALPMRSLAEAVGLRNHLLHCFEQAVREPDSLQRQRLLSFVIVGGGATGVELAGTLVELMRGPFRRDYPTLKLSQVQIILLQAGEQLLAGLPSKLGDYTLRKLQRLGVRVHLEARVNRVSPGKVELQDGRLIGAETIIWVAGVEAALPKTAKTLSTAQKGKVSVGPTLQALAEANVYAIGDLAQVQSPEVDLAGVAPEALQQGVAVARNIKRQLRGQAPQPFQYFNKGRLAIIGCYAGVGQIGPFKVTGFLAWLMWLVVHLVYLPGFRSRLLVLISWVHAYGFSDRAVRTILQARPAPTSILARRTKARE